MHRPLPVPLHSTTRYLCHPETEINLWPPPLTCRGCLQREKQRQPQHANLPATTAIYKATLEQSRFQRLIWNVHTDKTNLCYWLKRLICANVNEMRVNWGKKNNNIGNCVYCVEQFTITKWFITVNVRGSRRWKRRGGG